MIPEDIHLEPDVVFNTNRLHPLKLHLLYPKLRPPEPMPVVVFIFGGAFRTGNKDIGIQKLLPFAQKGYLCASIEYRYSSQAHFPAQVHDVKCAVRYLRAAAAELHLDPNRIGVFGESSGGYLTTMLAVTAGVPELEGDGGWAEQSSQIQAAVVFFGPTDFLAMNSAGSIQDHEAPDSPESELVGGAIRLHPEKTAATNPMRHIKLGQSLPPMLLIHGDADPLVPFGQSELLYAALENANAPVRFLKRVIGAGHGGAAFQSPEIEQLMQLFFQLHLRSR
jgi:acetyl esterase/lipase